MQRQNHSLDSLSEMTVAELDDVFASGDPPEADELDGFLEERILAGRGALRLRRLRGLVNTPLNPWKGKRVADEEGVNLLTVGPFTKEVAEFEVRTEPSVLDGDEAAVLSHVGDSPAVVQRIRDEVRRVGDGVYLGAASVKAGDGYRFVFYFGLRDD